MLRTLLAIEVDDKGKEVKDKPKTKNCKLFSDVAIDGPFMKDYCDKYPVTFVDF